MNTLKHFNFEGADFRVVERSGQPWFVAADVCRVLELANSRDAVSALDEDEKGVAITDTPGGGQKMQVISESGLYALIFKSRKAQARAFRKWVTAEVLPALRQAGRYEMERELQASERGRLVKLREMLLDTAAGVIKGLHSPAQAQAVAVTASRYLETLKLEGEAIGYATVFGMREVRTGGVLLPLGQGALQGVSQQGLRGEAAIEPGVPAEAIQGEEAVGGQE